MDTIYLTKVTELAKTIIKNAVNWGDFVVDGTMGNGNDTLFLAKLVGEGGNVVSFDIQKEAIENTKKHLKENHVDKWVTLVKDGHENIDKYVFNEISGAMFNLGYMPKGDQQIITKPETTIKAIQQCLKLLKTQGVITILIYYGHPGGSFEKDEILAFVEKLDPKEFHVLKIDFVNQNRNPPLLVAVVKK